MPFNPNIYPGPGYRLVQPGEILQQGDQLCPLGGKDWEPTLFPGHEVGVGVCDCTYRRKIETESVGEGYRLLQTGEVILPTDEVFHSGWGQTNPAGLRVGEPGAKFCKYRRKVEPAKPDTTVFAEVSPEACQAEAEIKGWGMLDRTRIETAGRHIADMQRKIAKQKAEIARLTSALDDARAVIGYAKEVLTNS